MNKTLFWIAFSAVAVPLLAGTLLMKFANKPVPQGEIERVYTASGQEKVAFAAFDAPDEKTGKFEFWYPEGLAQEKYPLIVLVNGTGFPATKYKSVFEHLASWGFIVAGNEDENTRSGASSQATLEYALSLNQDSSSPFNGKIDTGNIGIGGHSQGGVGTINAVTAQPGGQMYKAMFTASATALFWGTEKGLGADWAYNPAKIGIPCFQIAGTGDFDAGTGKSDSPDDGPIDMNNLLEVMQRLKSRGICPLGSMQDNFAAIPEGVFKVMARRAGVDHGGVQDAAKGYMTAWFRMWLADDKEAAKVFTGTHPEILSNPSWQDVVLQVANLPM